MILKNNLQVCEASKDEVSDLVNLLKDLFSIEKDFTFNEENHAKGLSLLIDEPNHIVIIGKFEEELVAMITIQTVISTVKGSKVGLIEDFIVKDDFRDMGIGTHLFSYIKEYAKANGFTRLQLVCDNDNEVAKEFYRNKKFEESNLTAWYYHF
ncbi:MAG: GNAT family N-acetyltransferase [Arcobacter sp.]|nr:MAG: GNAT family N-acetyltransferase [Arcobacter sp.]